jgi:electron transport complex protein RnfB
MRQIQIAEIDAILPQTQCRQCGFSGCKPYATAIVEGHAEINQCPPGGEDGIRKLAELLGVSPIPLNTAHGVSKPRAVALIDEQVCIGCTLCIVACPVDAIVGATKQMHAVITAECTGCELCIAPCPVDCISMIPLRVQMNSAEAMPYVIMDNLSVYEDKKKAADRARARYHFRLQRLEHEKQEQEGRFAQKTGAVESVNTSSAGGA